MFTISRDLWDRICEKDIPVRVHSRFRHAVNLQSGDGLVTLLAGGRCLQPASVLLDPLPELEALALPEGELRLTPAGLYQGERPCVPFLPPRVRDLALHNANGVAVRYAAVIRDFLAAQETGGLRGLIEGRCGDVYCSFLRPRIEDFRAAVLHGGPADAAGAAARLAGCGPGLTPSSDDLLCGYISVFPQTARNRQVCAAVTDAALKKTNDISAALLRNAKAGLFSADILDLFSAFRDGGPDRIQDALGRVARFGSSSGCDFLTGMYYGILDSNKKEG